jgi:hypothetical protein
VRPKAKYLEVCVFLGREVKSPLVHRVDQTSKTKVAHTFRITHRDQVEAPFTDWLLEAYELPDKLTSTTKKPAPKKASKRR